MKRDPRSEVRLTADVDVEPREMIKEEHDPFVIVVMGDFRGAHAGGPAGQSGPLGSRKLEVIDRDNFDGILQKFEVLWEEKSDAGLRLPIRSIDDFHPDRIADRVAPLRILLDTRRGLQDPARFDGVAEELAKHAGTPASAGTAPGGSTALPAGISGADLLSRILGESRPAAGKDEWSDYLQKTLRDAVGPHLVRIDAARQQQLTEAVDRELSGRVQSILHDPCFRRLEASWRSLWRLVRTVETGPDLKIMIVQASKADLLQDLYEHESLEQSGLARLLIEPATIPGAAGPALLIGDYEFSADLEDLALLERIGGIARALEAPFIASASPALLGCRDFGEIESPEKIERCLSGPESRIWQSLRSSPQARWLALALPHVLCRIPYGAATDPIETFKFEEAAGEGLLWGNPAFHVAGVIAAAFSNDGWSLDPGRVTARVDGLPFYACERDGETEAMPCAEVFLTERIVEAMELEGLIPMVSYRDADIVALPCLQSLANPRAPLTWGRT